MVEDHTCAKAMLMGPVFRLGAEVAGTKKREGEGINEAMGSVAVYLTPFRPPTRPHRNLTYVQRPPSPRNPESPPGQL